MSLLADVLIDAIRGKLKPYIQKGANFINDIETAWAELKPLLADVPGTADLVAKIDMLIADGHAHASAIAKLLHFRFVDDPEATGNDVIALSSGAGGK